MRTTPIDGATRHPRAWPAVPVRVGFALLVVLAAWGSSDPPAEAAQPCHMPGDFATLQEAVNVCTIINVAAGDYAGPIVIARDVTIRGAGADETHLVGGNPVVVIGPDAVVTTIAGVTIQGGASLDAGGILNEGTLTLQNSTVMANRTSATGGGLFNAGGTVTVQNSTIAGNVAGLDGGGLFNAGGTVTVRNSTVTGNVADEAGDDILNAGTLTLTHVTVGECVDVPPDGEGCPEP